MKFAALPCMTLTVDWELNVSSKHMKYLLHFAISVLAH